MPIRKLGLKWIVVNMTPELQVFTNVPAYPSHVQTSFRWINVLRNVINAPTWNVLVLYFIEYNVHTSIVHTWILQWFLAKKKYFYFSRIISQKIIIAGLFIIKAILNPSSNTCIVRMEYFSIIFNVKKCALYFIKYNN